MEGGELLGPQKPRVDGTTQCLRCTGNLGVEGMQTKGATKPGQSNALSVAALRSPQPGPGEASFQSTGFTFKS